MMIGGRQFDLAHIILCSWIILQINFYHGSVECTILEPPTITSTISSITGIEVIWTAPMTTRFDRYLVMYHGLNVPIAQRNVTVATTVTMVTLLDLIPGETYRVSVAAINGTMMAVSTPRSVTTKLNPPSFTSSIAVNTTSIYLVWAPSPSDFVDRFEILYRGQKVYTALSRITTFNRLAYLTNLLPGETYAISVTAISGIERANSIQNVTVTTQLNEPQLATISSTTDTISISWLDQGNYVEEYQIKLTGLNVDTTPRFLVVEGVAWGAVARNLTSGETYSIVVTAISDDVTAESVAVLKTTVPNTPTIVSLTASQSSITLDWTASAAGHIEQYIVSYRGLNTDTTSRNSTVFTEFATLGNLVSGETYVLTVTAVSGTEQGTSMEVRKTTPLNSPSITALTPTNSTLTISWSSPPGDFVELYYIRFTHGANTEVIQAPLGQVRDLVLGDLKPGGDYFILVEAVSGNQRAESLGRHVTLFPNQPVITSVTGYSTSSIGIAWQSPPQDTISSYELHYTGLNVDTMSQDMALAVTTTSYNLTGFNAGETYEIIVTALTMGTSENRRAASDAVFKTMALNPPSINLITSTATVMAITWSSMPDDYVAQYIIHLANTLTSAMQPSTTIVDGSLNRVTVTDLMPGHTYNVTVIANSSNVFASSATRQEILQPESVQLREIGSTMNSIAVEWDPPPGLVDYYTVTCSQGTPSADRINYSNGITVASCTGLSHPGGDYTISVISYSGAKMSVVASKVITALPDGVNLTESISTTTSVEATWTNPSGAADDFIINCDPVDEATPQPARIAVEPSTTEYSAQCVNLAGPGKIYTMTVTTVSGMKNSRSSTIQLTALPAAVVELSSATITTTSIDISWRKDPTCTTCVYDSFSVSYMPDSLAMSTTVSEVPGASTYSVRFTGLTPGKEYTFVVKSERNGKFSQDVSLVQRTKPARANIASNPTIANSSIIVYWALADGEHDSYRVTISPAEGAISLLADPSGAFITMLTPGKRYILSVVTVSGDMESDPTMFPFTTEPYAPGPILNLVVTIFDKNSVTLSFDPPNQPNGELIGYSVQYTGTAQGRQNHVGTLPVSDDLVVIAGALKPGFYYVFTVIAVNYYGLGQQTKTQPLYMMVYPPAAPTDSHGSLVIPKAAEGASVGSVVASTSTITVVLEEDTYTHDNGELVAYTIVVAEEEGLGNYIPSTGEITATLPNWSEAHGSNPMPPYQAFEPRAYPFPPSDSAGSSRRKRSTAEAVNIVIGNESCAGSTGYCNGPLRDDTYYIFHFRVFTQAGYADTAFSEPIRTDRDSSLALALGLSICFTLLFLAVIAFAVLLFLKKRRLKYNRHIKQGNENKGFESEVPALNNQAISLKKKKSSRPVRLADFPSHYSTMKADSEYLFSEEYEELRNVGRSQPVEAAILLSNRSKNRFANIQPYDHTRVKLTPIDDEEGSDYINGNYMPGYNSPREFIACQGPLPGTEEDMWRMIWEQKVEIVVMVTQLFEKGRLKCHKYWPEEGKPLFYGEIQVALMSEHNLKHWTLRELTLQLDGKIRSIQHYNFTSWPDHGVPDATEVLLSFVRTIRNQIPNNGTPTVVHCSAGVGRTGTFIALDRLMQHMREHDYVDIFGIVSEMRMHRNHMVQTEQQYVFIHECVIDLLQGHSSSNGRTNRNVNYKPDNRPISEVDDDEHFF